MNDYFKIILILASSCKFKNRCVAGFQLIKGNGDAFINTKTWIRPISSRKDGSLNVDEIWLGEVKRIARPLDIISVPILEQDKNPCHKEDWFIDPRQKWKYHRQANVNGFINNEGLETPEDLWLETLTQKNDSVSEYFIKKNNLQTLYFVKPINFRLSVQITNNNQKQRKKTRAIFEYNNKTYNLVVTDPVATRTLFPEFSELEDESFRKVISDVKGICVSLTEPFIERENRQYKIIASIIL
jgi:hypothetical protein